jgi:hypothetical protein
MSGLKNKLTSVGSPLSNLNGAQGPDNLPTLKASQLHDTYSINDIPVLPNKPAPSQLDLNGEIPANNYRDNSPEGTSF